MPRPRVLAVILAGGEGGRLEVLTEHRAKPAMPFAGVYRLIDFALSNCVHSGLSDVWVIEQYRPHSLNEHLANGRPWDLDRTYGGLQVLPPYQNRGGGDGDDGESGFAQGNADALYRHRHFLRDFGPDLVLVLSADQVYKLDFREVIDRHLAQKADVTLVTTRVPRADAKRFGVAQVNGDGRVTGFQYKPEEPASDLATAEVFVYDAPVLLETLERLAEEGKGDDSEEPLKDFGHELIPRLVEGGRAWEYRLEGYWRDLGTIDSYWRGHMDLLEPEPGLVLDDPAWPILTYGSQRLPARIEEAARIAGSLIAPGCRVAGRVERSVLAPGVVVEEGALVREAVLLHDVVVRAGAEVQRAIVDTGARLGKGARVGKDGEGEPGVDDLALVGQGVEVGDGGRVKAGERVGR